MPPGYAIADARTVRGPDGREYDVLDAIHALSWRPQLCPLMRHEYSIRGQGPDWAWNVINSMLLARNPDSFRAYFRGYQFANRYWDAPDGLRYWRGRMEIDRGQPDGVGLRRVAEGGKQAEAWAGPPWAPDGIGLYEQDERGRWWPTEAAIASGYQPCTSCARTKGKKAIVTTPDDPISAAEFIATAEQASRAEHGRSLSLDELEQVLQGDPVRPVGSSSDEKAGGPKVD